MSGGVDKLRAIGGALGVLALAGVFAIILPVAAFAAMSLMSVEPGRPVEIAVSVVLVQGVSVGGVALLYLATGPERPPVTIRWPSARDGVWMVGGTALALVSMFAGGVVVTLLGLDVGAHQIQRAGQDDPAVFAVLIPLSFLIIGPGEELLFRGVVQGRLRQAFGAAAAIAMAAVIFAAVHIAALTGPLAARLVAVAVLVLPSVVFGLAYERTRNIAVPAVIHGGYNAFLLALSYYAADLEAAADP